MLQKQQIELTSEAGTKLLAAIGESLAVGITLEIFPVAIVNFITACRSFYESAEKYCEALLDVRGEIERMSKLEKSLEKNREQEKINDLRSK
jgi:hypothetical protein